MSTPQPTEEQINFAAEVLKYIRREYADVRKGHEEPGIFTPRIDAIDTVLAALAASRRDSVRLDWIHNNSRRRAGGDSVIHEFTTPYPDDHAIRAAIDAASKGATG